MEDKCTTLEISDLRFSYEKGNEILHGISARFAKGKITALIGANGCGKSTLLNLLAGVLKPDAGQILLNEKNINSYSRVETARSIATVHQSNTAPEDMTVEKLVRTGRTPYHGLFRNYSKEDEIIVKKAMEDTDTGKYADRAVSALSGGQMQRVWLAMALAQDTGILLLDEITTYLDIRYQIDILHLIRKLNRNKNMTMIMVLHDINLALEFCDEVIVMKDGQITAQGEIGATVTEKVLDEAFGVSSKIVEVDNKKHCLFRQKGVTYAE